MATFYLNKNKAQQISNPNLSDHVYVSLNTNRNVPRKYQRDVSWKVSPDNASIDLWNYLERLTKKSSPLSKGSYNGVAAAFTAGLTEGAIFYNSATGQLETLQGQGAYADDSAAGTAGLSVGEHYYNTSSNSYVTKMA